jgi:hypothetical protein
MSLLMTEDKAWPKSEYPELQYDDWKDTCNTLHRWIQIVGKVRTTLAPWMNHSWSSTLYVSSRGLTTSLIPLQSQSFSIDLDFIQHALIIQTAQGMEQRLPLQSVSVAQFYESFCRMADELRIPLTFDVHPNEVPDPIPFHEDRTHRTYDPKSAHQFWKILVQVNSIFQIFRSRYVGKSSPVHLFWGSLDLAVTRFSGRRAPEHPGGIPTLSDAVTKEAYSHEVSSCGFWPGNAMIPYPAFYSYSYPQPEGYEKASLEIPGAFYHPTLKEFILPYEEVRKASNPNGMLLDFCQKTYEAAANLGHWDRKLLEDSPFLQILQDKQEKTFSKTKESSHGHSDEKARPRKSA